MRIGKFFNFMHFLRELHYILVFFSVVVDNLSPDQTYDFRVVAVDGRFETPSKIQEVYTYSSSTLPRFELDESRSRNVSHSGWFIGKSKHSILTTRKIYVSDNTIFTKI